MSGQYDTATPVRALLADGKAHLAEDGFVVLRDSDVSYRDGAEDEVLALVRSVTDRSSYSDAMVRRAKGWAQRYHSDPTRANVVRALNMPTDARVLEIGCGSGAITRYLGETCAVVDAIEPMPARAAAAAARCADQDNVTIFVGEAKDVPAAPTYDVIIVVGVLEYVGWGSADRAPYREFLADCYARLADGGTLVVAIENQLGVKYLVGAPEDHTRGLFDSLEDYPRGGHARTFSRRELTDMLADTGFDVRSLGAFPDYKLTRAVIGDFPAGAESLAYRIPRFPSPDWMGHRPRLASEQVAWETLVDAGLGADFVNSFVMVAGKGGPSRLWPAERCAVFYSSWRRPELVAETVVEAAGDSVVFKRRPLIDAAGGTTAGAAAGDAAAGDSAVSGTGAVHTAAGDTGVVATGAPIRLVSRETSYIAGDDLPRVIAREALAGGGAATAAPYLRQWIALLDEAFAAGAGEDGRAFDLVPHNLVVTDDGSLAIIDEELHAPGVSREHIVARGLYHLAKEVTARTPARVWGSARTVGDVMVALGAAAGLDVGLATARLDSAGADAAAGSDVAGSWVEEFLDTEATLQAQVRDRRPHDVADADWIAQVRGGIAATVAKKLTSLPFGDRLPAQHARARTKVASLDANVRAARSEVAQLKKALAAARSRTLRARCSRLARRVAGAALPVGTRRRAVVARAVRKVRGR